ncbi:hypothetical protein JCM10599A_65370 [Paraburkholderia kururiensis]
MLAHAASLLLAALAARAAEGREAATHVFSALTGSTSNPHIASEWPRQASTTAGLRDLEQAGESLFLHASGRRIAPLADYLAARCAIPTQPAHGLACIASAILAGLIKHHLLLAQASALHLPGLLAAQMPAIGSDIDDSAAATLGYLTAASFAATIPPRLAAVTADFPGASRTPPPAATPYGLHSSAVPPAIPATSATPATPTRDRAVKAGYAGPVHYAGLPVSGSRFALPAISAPAPATSAAATATPSPTDLRSSTPVRPPGRRASPWLLAALVALVATGLFAWMTLSGQQPGEAAPHTATSGPVQGPVPAAAPPAPAMAASAASTPAASVAVPAASAASATAAAAAASMDPVSWLDARSSAAGVPAVDARLASDAQRATLEHALDARFGSARPPASVSIDAAAGPPPWLDHLDALLPVLAVPRAELSVQGHRVQLGGLPAPQAATWRQQLQQALGPAFTVAAPDDPASARLQATDAFLRAMAALLQTPEPCQASAAVPVLNLQPLDFAPSSGHVPPAATENLTQTARLLAACAARGQPLHLSIDAWTDRHGDPAANLALSHKRADAVRAFLAAAGVPPATLTARGYGATDPVAGNLTDAGRLANRRIRFTPLPP